MNIKGELKITKNLGDAFFILEEGGEIVQANPSALQLVQQTALKGLHFSDIFLPRPAELLNLVDEVSVSRIPQETLIILPPKNKKYHAKVFPLEEGLVVHLEESFPENKETRADFSSLPSSGEAGAIKPSAKESRKVAERLKMVLDTAVDGIITIDEKGGVETMNQKAEEIFGYASHEVVGQNIKMLMPEPYHSGHDGYLERYLAGGAPRVLGIGREVQGRRKDGSLFPMDLSVSEATIENHRMFTGLVRDITERKKAEEALHQAKEEAETANKAKSQFLSNMSHDLRTPLTAILGFSQLLNEDNKNPLTFDQQENVSRITGAGRHLLDLINEVLDLSRIEAGRVIISLQLIPPTEAIKECLTLSQAHAEHREVQLEFSPAEDLPALVVDLVRFRQVMNNLISNAIKYNRPEGKVTIRVLTPEETTLRIEVEDTGKGIAPDLLDDVFEPFNRLGADKTQIEGTGIGLSICRRLVGMMGGTIGLESRQGQGSTFWVTFPAKPGESGKMPATAKNQTSEKEASAEREGNFTLLYVEDSPVNLKLMEKILLRRGDVTMVSAKDGAEGLEKAKELRPDLIFMDINLPDMQGFQVYEALKAQIETENIPVIALSANAMPEDIKKGITAGFLEYLTKPFDIAQINQTLDQFFKGL